MKDYFLKLRILFPAHFVITLGMVPIYGLIRYFTLVPINPHIQYQFMSAVWDIVLPGLLPIIPYILYYRHRLKGITFRKETDRRQDGLSVISYFSGVIVLMLTSMYVQVRFGHQVQVASPTELSEAPPGNFYFIDEFAVPRNWGTFFTHVSTSGKSNSTLHFNLLFASPFLNHASDSAPESPEFWYGVRHNMSMSNRATTFEKDAALKAFQEESLKKMENWDFQKVVYFKRVPKSEDLFYYNRAISNRIRVNNHNQFIILEAVDEPFADRAGSKGIWILYSWLIGTGTFLLVLLAGKPSALYLLKARLETKPEESWIDTILSSFRLERHYVVTPILSTLLLFMTVLMAFCGVLGGYLDNPALEFWGGLRRPEAESGAWWTLASYGFLSTGPLVGLVNVVIVAYIGRSVERALGSQTTFWLLLAALLAGGIFSLYVHPIYWVAGSSPMVLALCMGFLTTLSFRRKGFPTTGFVFSLGYTLLAVILGFLDYMDHFANLGGIVGSLSVLFLSGKTRFSAQSSSTFSRYKAK